MNISTIKTYKWYIDYYEETEILVSSTTNPYDKITSDENGNYISSVVHSGKNYIYPTTKTMSSPIIVYDDAEFLYIDTIKSYMRFLIKPTNEIKYHYGAEKIVNPSVISNEIQVSLLGKYIFKLFINGNEDKNYTYDDTGIISDKITGVNDYIELYLYDDSTIDGSITFVYQSPQKLIPDESYFNNLQLIEKFNSMDVNENLELQSINQTYRNKSNQDRINKLGEINITMFEDIRNNLRNKAFRLMGYSELNKKMVMYINCDFVASSQINRSYEKDDLPYTIRYEEEIYGEFLEDSNFYGSGIYGDKVYGTNITTEVIE